MFMLNVGYIEGLMVSYLESCMVGSQSKLHSIMAVEVKVKNGQPRRMVKM
jgi:hypothetical protein